MTRSPWLDFSDDYYKPRLTIYNGGPDRQKQIWEACRAVNAGGYGSGVVQNISSMGCATDARQVTSCSPFTATAVGMMFDTRPGVTQTNFEPMFDGGNKPLGRAFYQMHNGIYFALDNSSAADLKRTTAKRKARLDQWAANNWPGPATSWDDSAMSLLWHNLGYRIDPRDMRTGDLVAIDWSPSNGGHAVFCWDVHLSGDEVDCFTFVSSNGSGTSGAGISVYCGLWTRTFDYANGKYTAKSLITPVFDDHDTYVEFGAWHCLPGKRKEDVNKKTFKKTPVYVIDSNSYNPKLGYNEYVGSCRVIRFWGVAPPANPHGNLLTEAAEAQRQTRWQPPESQSMGTAPPPQGRVPNIQPAPVPATHPDPIKATPPKPAPPQKKEEVVPHQHFVEDALLALHNAGWIDVAPGDPTSVADPKTKSAVEDFQKKFKVPPIDGIAGRKTRPALEKAVADLHAGKPNPNKPSEPSIEQIYWLANRVAEAGELAFAVQAKMFEAFTSFAITLQDKTGKTATVTVPRNDFNDRGVATVKIPPQFPTGSELSTKVSGTASGTTSDKTTTVKVHVGGVTTSQRDWPWDEAKWTPYMRGVIAELRATPKDAGNFTQREITQYGVKEALQPGEVQIMGKVGKNVMALPLAPVAKLGLYLADIEGTLRWQGRVLNIVQSGNVYDKPVTRVINGKPVTKMKPTLEKFDPAKSIWVDVTDLHPWGSGARMRRASTVQG